MAELSQPHTISATMWMRDFFLGVDEEALLADRARFVDVSAFPGELAFRHASGQTAWRAGRFESVSVAELHQRVMASSVPALRATIPITVVDGVDIGRAQAALATADRALVQIASNFNALEVPNRTCAPDYGGLVTRHATDATQGPAASFGVPAASLLRAHYAFYAPATEPAAWGQTLDRQLELLADVRQYFGACVNGKVTLAGDERPIGEGDELSSVADRIRVGLHADAEVVFDRAPPTARGRDGARLRVLPTAARPLVDQLLCASVNLHSPGERPADREPQKLANLVRACLRAAYRAAYLAAIARDRRRLLLTLVGGGVFGNDLDAILDAIAEAHAEWAPRSQLEEVRLCLYTRGTAAPIDAQLKARLGGRCA